MTDTLREALRRDVDGLAAPTVDAERVVAQGERRLRRRRVAAACTTVALVVAVVVAVLLTRATTSTLGPLPVSPPSPDKPSTGMVKPHGTRPLVYADGSTVHVGDHTVEARDPVAFIAGTDDGAVYEAALDGTLWFTDGTTTSVIGTSGFTAAPTAHDGVVTTGTTGSLVVWGDLAGREDKSPVELVVFDTSKREEVARISMRAARVDRVVHVDDDHVWLTSSTSGRGCWVWSIHPCKDPHVVRFDVATGTTTELRLAELNAELGSHARMFVGRGSDLEVDEPAFSDDADFRQVGARLAAITADGHPSTLTRSNGDDVRLRLPDGFTVLGQAVDASVISVSQWLDDDHVVVWANGGGGDLPAQRGDLLVCALPHGVCQVAVPRSARDYVAP